MRLSRSITLIPFLLGGLFADAQTMFISDPYLRGWLNDAKPGSVDADGYCDTLNWNAVPPNSASFNLWDVPNNTTVDLEGIQYLKLNGLDVMDIEASNITVAWPGHPRVNRTMTIEGVDVDLFTGAFYPWPDTLDWFTCNDCGMTQLPAMNEGVDLYMLNVDLSGQTLVVPEGLYRVGFQNCNITEVPPLPAGLGGLTLSDDSLTAWPALPASLRSLYASHVGLDFLPPMPPNMLQLQFRHNNASTLTMLNEGLIGVDLSYNAFTSIPPLPNSVTTLVMNSNPITTVDGLPGELETLLLDTCPVVSILAFNDSLQYVDMRPATQLTSLPAQLPSRLAILRIPFASGISCVPPLPESMIGLCLFGTSVQCLPNIPPDLITGTGQYQLGIEAVVCDPGGSPCPTAEPKISGRLFDDANENGVLDGGEAPRPNSVVVAQPGDYLAGADMNGRYVMPVDIGTFNVTGVPDLYETVTTAPFDVTLTAPGQVDSLNDVGFHLQPGMYDLVVEVEGTPARPGFGCDVWLHVRNAGTEPTAASVQLTHDANLVYGSSSDTPGSINGNVLGWSTPLLAPGASWSVHTFYSVPVGLALGTPLLHAVTADPDQPDQTTADNTAVLNDTVVGSYDPNDKRVEPALLSPDDVLAGKRVEYTVRFQNTGTFAAERVLITDTLSPDLQWATMRELASSHVLSWHIRHGVLHMLFEGINLPDSMSDEPGSHGFVKFSFVPSSSLMLGESVGNTANIYFDFNEPIITNEAVFSVESSTAVDPFGRVTSSGVETWPNPVENMLYVKGVEGSNMEVLDVTGRVVLRERCTNAPHSLDLRSLVSGGYTLRVPGIGSQLFIKR